MVESEALLVGEVLPHEPMRQLTPGMACSRAMQEQLPRVLSFPYQLRFLFAGHPELMSYVKASFLEESDRTLQPARPEVYTIQCNLLNVQFA